MGGKKGCYKVEGECKTLVGKEDGAAMRKCKQKYGMWYKRKSVNSRKKPAHPGCRGQNVRLPFQAPLFLFSLCLIRQFHQHKTAWLWGTLVTAGEFCRTQKPLL